MEVLGLLFALLVLAVSIGSVLGWIAFIRLDRLQVAVIRLESQLTRQAELPNAQPDRPTGLAGQPQAARTAPPQPFPPQQPPPPPRPRAEPTPTFLDKLVDNVRKNWMIWLGGTCVGLAGVFLVTYSIEMGLLGPTARIVVAVIAGLMLHAAAEWLRRRTGQAHPAFAALAGGASITLYAALFAGLVLYALYSPGTAFALLAVISLLTMALALLHGPVLAIIGILGAYLVPILVSDNSGNIMVALIYALIVTAAAFLLLRYVYRAWLWYGTVAGALAWWLISTTSVDADGFRGIYLAAFAYLALGVPVFDWALRRQRSAGDPGTETVIERFAIDAIGLTILAVALAQAISIALFGDVVARSAAATATGFRFDTALIEWSPLIVVVMLAARTRISLYFAPWLLLITQWFAWLIAALGSSGGTVRLEGLTLQPDQGPLAFLTYAMIMAALYSLGSWYQARGRSYDALRSSLLYLAPVLWLALAYLLVTDLSTSWLWALATLGLGLIYMLVSGLRLQRSRTDQSTIWLTLAAHAAYSLAAAMLLREATLTLALAAQLVSLAWLRRRYDVPALDWIVKVVLAVVVVRLTLNPWLLTYPSDVHWSLWTYGGSVLCCLVASQLTPIEIGLRRWLEAATLHLLVMFLGAELRWWLYDGSVFAKELTLTETAIDAVLWGALGLTYFHRSKVSEKLSQFYVLCSRVLIVLAMAAYALSSTLLNPVLNRAADVGTTPIWNLLLVAYGAPVLIALAAYLYYDPRFRKLAAVIAGGGFLFFVSLEIRHLFTPAMRLTLPTTDAESYTYSATWMVLAVFTILASTRLGLKDGYRAGMGLLFVVIAKIFLVDMSDLEGLLRVASFMGLGLALLGLAYLYQRISRQVGGDDERSAEAMHRPSM